MRVAETTCFGLPSNTYNTPPPPHRASHNGTVLDPPGAIHAGLLNNPARRRGAGGGGREGSRSAGLTPFSLLAPASVRGFCPTPSNNAVRVTTSKRRARAQLRPTRVMSSPRSRRRASVGPGREHHPLCCGWQDSLGEIVREVARERFERERQTGERKRAHARGFVFDRTGPDRRGRVQRAY